MARLTDNGGGSGGLVLPGRGKDADGLVVAGKTVDTRLDENEAELGVLVLAVALKVLADGDGLEGNLLVCCSWKVDRTFGNFAETYLLDEAEQVLGELGSKAFIHHSVSQFDQTEA